MDVERNSAGHFWYPALSPLAPQLASVEHGQKTEHDENDTTSGTNHYSSEVIPCFSVWKSKDFI